MGGPSLGGMGGMVPNMGMGQGAPMDGGRRPQRNLDGPPMDIQQSRVLEPLRQKIEGSRTVFVGNLSDQITDDDMLRLFNYCGEIENIEWINDKRTGKFKGCAFIEFYEDDATLKAVENNGVVIFGRPLRVDFASNRTPRGQPGGNRGNFDRQGDRNRPPPRDYDRHYDNRGPPQQQQYYDRPPRDDPPSERPPGCKTLFIGHLSDAVDDEIIHQTFASAGKIKAIRWLNDKQTNKFKGCGFIEFFDEEATIRGIELNGTVVLGKRMRVDYSQGPRN